MNIISRIGTAPVTHAAPKTNDPASPALQPQTKHQQGHQVPPSFSTAAMSVPGNVDTSTIGNSEAQLRRQGLECLVAVLKSLVAWGTATPEQPIDPTTRPQAEESRRDTMTPDFSVEKLSPGGADVTRGPTPELADDPTKFESAKQKKTTLLEGIKKFNFKPKRVCLSCWSSPASLMNLSTGHSIPHRARIHCKQSAQGYRALPSRDRRPQQGGYWRVPW